MSKQTINVGSTANDKNGDSLRNAFQKVNANFTELYTGYISVTQLKEIAAASTDFNDFKARIAAL